MKKNELTLYTDKEKKGLYSKKKKKKVLDLEEIYYLDPEEQEKIILNSEDYPGEIVETEEGYFISLKEKDGRFSWFLIK